MLASDTQSFRTDEFILKITVPKVTEKVTVNAEKVTEKVTVNGQKVTVNREGVIQQLIDRAFFSRML